MAEERLTHPKINLSRGCSGVGGSGLCTFSIHSSKTTEKESGCMIQSDKHRWKDQKMRVGSLGRVCEEGVCAFHLSSRAKVGCFVHRPPARLQADCPAD